MDLLVGMVKVSDADRSRAFYVDVLGLTYLDEDSFAVALRSGSNMVRLIKDTMFRAGQHSTVMGWETEDIEDRVRQLRAKGVSFLQYAWFEQDELGVWTAPNGDKVAWFTDPDGNVLSLSRLNSPH